MASMFRKAAYNEDDANTFLANSQINANLLLLWCEGTEKQEEESDRDIAIGISSGAAALAAAELGYKTGFCKCFIGDTVEKLLRKQKIKTFNQTYLMLGIGKPNTDFDIRVPVINGKPQRKRISQGKKNILIRRVD